MAREFAKDLDRPENSQLLRLANDAAFAFAKRALRAQIENYLGKDGATEAAIKALDDLTESQMVLCFPELDAAWRNLQNRANAIQQEQERRKADAKRPVNVLGNAYSAYILLRRCHEAREGYAVIYISDAELERSRQAIKRIEKALKPQLGPSDDINRTWNRANDYADQRPITLELCQSSYTWLMQQYKAITPQENYLEKDF